MRRLGTQHQVRKVHVPGVRRHVRALGHEAHVTQVTVIHDLPVDLAIDRLELARRGGIDGIEQGREGLAQAEAATAAVADVEDAVELLR